MSTRPRDAWWGDVGVTIASVPVPVYMRVGATVTLVSVSPLKHARKDRGLLAETPVRELPALASNRPARQASWPRKLPSQPSCRSQHTLQHLLEAGGEISKHAVHPERDQGLHLLRQRTLPLLRHPLPEHLGPLGCGHGRKQAFLAIQGTGSLCRDTKC